MVSNTSPIWNLASIERLDLLHDQFQDIRIPQDVWRELLVGQDYPEVIRIRLGVEWNVTTQTRGGFFYRRITLSIRTKRSRRTHLKCLFYKVKSLSKIPEAGGGRWRPFIGGAANSNKYATLIPLVDLNCSN